MKRFLPCVCLAFLAVACFQPKENLSEVALGLCKYIPDHGPVDGSEAYLTPEFYDAYVAAFDAPVADYGEIGENEWLFYFVTGNGEADPAYTVKSVKKVDKTTATAHISVQQVWAGEIDPKEPVAEYDILMKKVDNKWLLDDFDNKKQACIDYVKALREKYKSGEIIRYMESDDYAREYIPEFEEELREYYKKYGE
jgi:hypothetical protein